MHDSNHLVARFTLYSSNSEDGYYTALLGITPLEDETKPEAEQHESYINSFLSVFSKELESLVAIIADSVAVKKALAYLMGIGLSGYASHCINLVVKGLIAEKKDLVKFQNTIVKLRHYITSANLQMLIALSLLLQYATRWSSTHAILNRYVELRLFLLHINNLEFGVS